MLEVKVLWSEDGDDGLGGVRRVKGAVGCGYVHVEVALGYSVEGNDGRGYVGSDLHDDLAPSQHVSLGKVVLKEEDDL